MAKLDKGLKDILDKYEIDYTDKSKLWDCHGTLVLYHKAYEVIAAKENIKFDLPHIIEGNSKDKVVSISVMGHMGNRSEWSFGEAAPNNNKNAYPYAMAEKRAKDRVIAKLVGLAQYVYSEEEADDFKAAGNSFKKELREIEKQEMTGIEKDVWIILRDKIRECFDMDALNALKEEAREIWGKMDKPQQDAISLEIAKRAEYFIGE